MHDAHPLLQVYVLAISLSFMPLPFAMFCSILRNAASNLTAYERSNRGVYPHLRGGNPFDRGLVYNMKEFFGKNTFLTYYILHQQTQVLAMSTGRQAQFLRKHA